MESYGFLERALALAPKDVRLYSHAGDVLNNLKVTPQCSVVTFQMRHDPPSPRTHAHFPYNLCQCAVGVVLVTCSTLTGLQPCTGRASRSVAALGSSTTNWCVVPLTPCL